VLGRAILVIKLGALGDFVQALGPLAAIRHHHADQAITLLTTSPYAPLATASGLVDQVHVDTRPRGFNFAKWRALRRFLREGNFHRVYDLQTSDRSSWYRRLFFPDQSPEWSGIAPGCSHPHANPNRDLMHTIERQREQLAVAGIDDVPSADLSWVATDLSSFRLPERYALLVPGGAPHRPAKRWPVARYRELANWLSNNGIMPVVVGTRAEAMLAKEILDGTAQCIDLTGRTDIIDLAALAGKAVCAIGNDTGPMHVTAVAGCPSIVLFSGDSDPKLCAPRGEQVSILCVPDLTALSEDKVISEIELFKAN